MWLNQLSKKPFFSSIGSIWFSTVQAELRDKSFLAVFLLSTSTNNMALLAGALTSFIFTVMCSSYVGLVERHYLQEFWLPWATLGTFVLFELVLLLNFCREKDAVQPEVTQPLVEQEEEVLENKWSQDYVSSLLFVTLSEIGDNTMLATAQENTKNLSPVPILIGVLAAFTMTTLLAMFLGKNLAHCLTRRQLFCLAAILQLLFTVFHVCITS